MTPIFNITELESSTNNKFIVHNQALAELEVYGNGSIIEARDTEPMSPNEGDFYLIYPTGASASWTSQDLNLTVWNGTGWTFFPAVSGCTVKDLSTNRTLTYNGTTWLASGGDLPESTVGSSVVLDSLDARIQVINPSGTLQDVALPSPAPDISQFVVINDSDNLSASGNTVTVSDSSGGTILLTLDDTTGLSFATFTWVSSLSKWVIH